MNQSFEEIIKKENPPLHKLNTVYKLLPKNISKLNSLIFYGPIGSGKYLQVLKLLKNYSPSNLKYDKKMLLTFNKQDYCYKISDIHIEIDMALLGCNSKVLWNDIYYHIIDIVNAKQDKTIIVVCKNFNEIHSELLDVFYSYMQDIKSIQNTQIVIKYILLTTDISFISDKIINLCDIIPITKPTKNKLVKSFGKDICNKNNDISNLSNLKYIKSSNIKPHIIISNNILEYIINYDNINFTTIRELLYDLLIYNVNIYDSINYIVTELIENKHISKNIDELMIKMYVFLKYYNNNYRPIYHLESFIFNIIKEIHGL